MRKVVLMYHSVSGPACPAVAGSFPVSLGRFAAQVSSIRERGWRFGRLSQLHHPVDADTAYITSDDGTVDWARNALPWCEEHAVPTHTSIITGVWADQTVYPIAHRVQVLLAIAPSDRLPRPPLTDRERDYIDRIYAYETDPARRYLKGACNVLYDFTAADAFLGPPQPDCRRLLAERFAAADEYRRFALAEVGPHTVLHSAYGGDADGYFRDEVQPCRQALLDAGLNVNRMFTLPVKPKDGISLDPLCDVLRRNGFAGMLHNPGEWDRHSFIVTRIDAKQVEQFFGLPAWKD